MNKVYFAIADEDVGGWWFAAPNIKDAKQIAMGDSIIYEYIETYMDLKIHIYRDANKKPLTTETYGRLDMEEVNSLGLNWWACPKCDKEDFKIISDNEYECTECGYQGKIPYMNY